jgi:hypothetical protein
VRSQLRLHSTRDRSSFVLGLPAGIDGCSVLKVIATVFGAYARSPPIDHDVRRS